MKYLNYIPSSDCIIRFMPPGINGMGFPLKYNSDTKKYEGKVVIVTNKESKDLFLFGCDTELYAKIIKELENGINIFDFWKGKNYDLKTEMFLESSILANDIVLENIFKQL